MSGVAGKKEEDAGERNSDHDRKPKKKKKKKVRQQKNPDHEQRGGYVENSKAWCGLNFFSAGEDCCLREGEGGVVFNCLDIVQLGV